MNTLALVPSESEPMTTKRSFNPLRKFFSFFSFSSDDPSSSSTSTSTSLDHATPRGKNPKNHFKKNMFFYIPIAIVVLIVIGLLVRTVGSANNNVSAVAGLSDNRVKVPEAEATQTLNKTFAFPLNDENGKELSKIKMTLTTAELRDQIVVKGQQATAIDGRIFLIINIKLSNDYSKAVAINTRDYIRLSVNGSSEKMAADIHNDPVEAQAISTKFTRLGFPINDTDKDLTLYVGEINGKKEVIKLNLQ